MAAVPIRAGNEKLRTVLDYLPCEACLADPVEDHDVLCSVCRRLDRQVAVKLVTNTSIILERPEPEPVVAPVAIPPAQEAMMAEPEPEGPLPVEVVLKRRGFFGERRHGAAIEVVVEPYEVETHPAVAPLAALPEPEVEEKPAFVWEDLASYEGGHPSAVMDHDQFGVAGGYEYTRPQPEPEPVLEAPEVVVEETEEELPQDDFVFRAPSAVEEGEESRADEADETWMPSEEIPLEPPTEGTSPWAPPVEDDWSPTPAQEDVYEYEILERGEEIVTLEVLTDEAEHEAETHPAVTEPATEVELAAEPEPTPEPVEEVVEPVSEPEPTPATVAAPMVAPAPTEAPESDDSDLWRLDGFTPEARAGLQDAGVNQVAHLSGRDFNEVAERTGQPRDVARSWVLIGDFVHEAGIPLDAAKAMLAAGIEGPGGLAPLEAEDVVQRVEEHGGRISLREVKRWKRRV